MNPPRPLQRGSNAPFVDMAAVDGLLPRLRSVTERAFPGSGARFQNGDVLLARISPSLENGKTAIVDALSPGEVGFGSTELTVLGPRRATAAYLYYLLKWDAVRGPLIARRVGTSGRLRVPTAAWDEISVALPPLAEQDRITAILGAVDASLAAAQALAAQLHTLRAALVRDTFTRPCIQQRGDQLFSLGGGHPFSAITPDPAGDTLFLKVDDLAHPDNRRSIHTAAARFQACTHPGIRVHPPGHLVFPKRGGAIAKNRVRVLAHPAAVDPNLMVLAPRRALHPHAFAEALQFRGLATFADDAGIPQINFKHLYPVRFAVPPLEAQRALHETLTALDARIHTEHARQEALLALRSSLLSDLLTGRRRPAPTVPEPPPQPPMS
ncbi:restriction endonuclease subunit S [Chondromyces apiculatus]|uniref:restriction endonuclease subunit S n=1 Tax=Chondromyces apiculatus TaxID=51 RepID=UPI001E32838C|nr:restriction endonuclease subunit S [Chondromyces apiculatus]